MKVFISQPMKDLTPEEIQAKREQAVEAVKLQFPDTKIELIDSYDPDFVAIGKAPVAYLGNGIYKLAEADLAVFVGTWYENRGCKIENTVCQEYGIKFICIEL